MDSDFILKEEAEVYDRQLRLWGLPAQKKIKNSRLCVSGLSALAGEVCKNLILAGIGELTLLDVTLVDAGDIYGNYLFSAEDIDLNKGKAAYCKLSRLNPRVQVQYKELSVDWLTVKENLRGFDLVVVTSCSLEKAIKVDSLCRELHIGFFFGRVSGYYGFAFLDLGLHKYTRIQQDPKEFKPEFLTVAYAALQEALSTTLVSASPLTQHKRFRLFICFRAIFNFEEINKRLPLPQDEIDQKTLIDIKNFILKNNGFHPSVVPDTLLLGIMDNFLLELGPVVSIVGGVLAQEIIKSLTQQGCPLNNTFFYDGVENEGTVEQFGATI